MERYTQRQAETWALAEGSGSLPCPGAAGPVRGPALRPGAGADRTGPKAGGASLQGKNKTVQFKELMARKLVNQQLRLRLEQYRLP